VRIDRASLPFVRGLLREARAPLVALASHRFDALRRRFAGRGRRLRLQRRQQLFEDQHAVPLHARVRREAPDREAFLHHVHVDMRPPGLRVFFRVLRIHGTSTSTSSPTSASAMFGIIPAKHGEEREMLR